MWRQNKKVIGPPSMLHATCAFVDYILLVCVALTAKLEAANKALTEERAARQVANQALHASQETSSAMTRDLQSVRALADVLKEELSAKSAALDESVDWECEAQIRL
jgi:hypothetical protein